MRILFLSDLPPYDGGSGYSGAELHNGLVDRGYKVITIAPLYPDRKHGEHYTLLGAHRHVIVASKRAQRLLCQTGEPSYWHAVTKEHKEISPDIIMANSAGFAPTAFELQKEFGTPFMVIIRGYPVWPLIKNEPEIERLNAVINALKHALKVVTVSHSLSKQLKYHSNIDSVVIKNSPVVKVKKAIPSFSDRKFDALYVGTLTKRKNPFEAVRICKQMSNGFREVDLTIIGQGALRELLQSYLSNSTNKPKFRMLGFLPNSEAVSQMANHKVLILPSRFEGDPRVIHEAAEWGTPALVPECTWSIEQNHGIVKYKSIDEAANSLKEIISNKSYWKKLSRAAKNRVNLRRPADVLSDYEFLIRNILENELQQRSKRL